MIPNTIQKWCYTDTEYNEAKQLQTKHNELDPQHKELPKVVVIDCRERY